MTNLSKWGVTGAYFDLLEALRRSTEAFPVDRTHVRQVADIAPKTRTSTAG